MINYNRFNEMNEEQALDIVRDEKRGHMPPDERMTDLPKCFDEPSANINGNRARTIAAKKANLFVTGKKWIITKNGLIKLGV